jgi:hypothetical protein
MLSELAMHSLPLRLRRQRRGPARRKHLLKQHTGEANTRDGPAVADFYSPALDILPRQRNACLRTEAMAGHAPRSWSWSGGDQHQPPDNSGSHVACPCYLHVLRVDGLLWQCAPVHVRMKQSHGRIGV